ncbi:protein-disulfide reductase DsbD [Martelella sp. HB161492]|uniref:protein-disulfide reductase DsbD n=1 Tax=Martelella sp. HB161492 TaxID=2720726 RepID=UPI001590AF7A|nr:protein-disulfide reductase DsbD [Martelella sp. HB161492]
MSAFFRFSYIWLLVFLTVPVIAARAEMPLPADDVFHLSAARDGKDRLVLDWTIAPGTYLYRDAMTASLDGSAIALALPPGEARDDPNFGRVAIYQNHVSVVAAGLPADGTLSISYQGCAEKGICYPPVEKTVDLATLDVNGKSSVGTSSGTFTDWAPEPVKAGTGVATAAETPAAGPAETYLAGHIVLMLAGFLGFGLLMAFTPCIFPMVPILSAMLAGARGPLSTGRSFALSLSYGLAIATAYGFIGLVAGWSGANLQAVLQSPVALGISSLVFVALALSMFGLFELRMPDALSRRFHGRGRTSGSFAGAAILGFGSALIVGPCVTPPLAAAMLYAVSTGAAVRGGAALFALGFGMALPLIAFGTFGARALPRSGPWLERVRRGFGVVFLAVAILLLTRLVPAAADLALWGAFALGLSVFLGGFDRLDGESGFGKRAGKAAGLFSALVAVVMIVDASAGGTDPLQPLASLAGRVAVEAPSERDEVRVSDSVAFDHALSGLDGKIALVSFSAGWCTVCKSNERLMATPEYQGRLDRLPVITVDVTRQDTGSRQLMARFAVIGPPTLFLIDADGQEIPGSRVTGALSASAFSKRLAAAGV